MSAQCHWPLATSLCKCAEAMRVTLQVCIQVESLKASSLHSVNLYTCTTDVSHTQRLILQTKQMHRCTKNPGSVLRYAPRIIRHYSSNAWATAAVVHDLHSRRQPYQPQRRE
jgi:hypothetical protein